MQQLDVAGHLWDDLLAGRKTNTIRWRETRVVPGLLIFVNCDDGAQTALVEVTRCTDLPLREAAAFLGMETQWPDDVMLEGMRRHYPEISLGHTVQIAEFTLLDRARVPGTPGPVS